MMQCSSWHFTGNDNLCILSQTNNAADCQATCLHSLLLICQRSAASIWNFILHLTLINKILHIYLVQNGKLSASATVDYSTNRLPRTQARKQRQKVSSFLRLLTTVMTAIHRWQAVELKLLKMLLKLVLLLLLLLLLMKADKRALKSAPSTWHKWPKQ